MVGTALRRSGWIDPRSVWLAIARCAAFAVALGGTSSAHAQTGPFFEPQALDPMGYELRISAEYNNVSRSDFSRPVFLFAQGLSQLHVHEVRLQFDLRISITPALALQIVIPWAVRDVAVQTVGLEISDSQTLPPQAWNMSSSGLGDPKLALGYRLFQSRPWAAYAELGASIPIDDNPGSNVLPERVPLGTGQHTLFLGAGATLERPIAASLAYRFIYFPGEHATYLVRRTGEQSFTSGALAPFAHHRLNAAAELALSRVFSVRLAPTLTFAQIPLLVERNGSRQVLRETVSTELDLAAAIRVRLGAHHRLEFGGSLPLLSTSDIDPFFPIVVPTQGVGITWLVVGS